MNRENIENLLGSIILDSIRVAPNQEFDNITNNLQGAKASDIVLYKLGDSEKARLVFKQRLDSAENCLLILNNIPAYLNNRDNLIRIEEKYWNEAERLFLDYFYSCEKQKIKIVGVTGTNGKTTVVNLARQIAAQMGYKAASLGTLGYCDDNGASEIISGNTTPSYIDLRKIIYNADRLNDVLFMEVSSHALDQDRLRDIVLDLCAWTNFSQDHLDYHHTMDDYFHAKTKVVDYYLKDTGICFVSSGEDELFQRLQNVYGKRVKKVLTLAERAIHFLPTHLEASFNKANLEVALSLCEQLWGKIGKINFHHIYPPKGRCSVMNVLSGIVVIDYAHTPEALENICQALRSQYPDYRLKIVFGCGGDRDAKKRPLMGAVAQRFADEIIITSDNPRFEEPKKIIEDILVGIKKSSFVHVIENRQEAIEKALSEMKPDHLVLIAGKGHENYQDVKGVKYPYSDFNVVKGVSKGA